MRFAFLGVFSTLNVFFGESLFICVCLLKRDIVGRQRSKEFRFDGAGGCLLVWLFVCLKNALLCCPQGRGWRNIRWCNISWVMGWPGRSLVRTGEKQKKGGENEEEMTLQCSYCRCVECLPLRGVWPGMAWRGGSGSGVVVVVVVVALSACFRGAGVGLAGHHGNTKGFHGIMRLRSACAHAPVLHPASCVIAQLRPWS